MLCAKNGISGIRPSKVSSSGKRLPCTIPRRMVSLSATSAVSVVEVNGKTEVEASPAPAVAPVTVNVPEQKPAVLPPQANFENIVNIGQAKAGAPAGRVFLMGIMAGCYIAFGAVLMLAVGSSMPSLATNNPGLHKLLCAAVFPVGLLMVTMNSPELFTGNTALTAAAYYEGKMKLGDVMKNWFWSYMGNFVGSLIMVAAVMYTGVITNSTMPAGIAEAKTSLSWGVALVRAILTNWLVCVAVLHASAAQSLPGKMMGLWAPITAFVAIGLEHSIANMFIIPLGMVMGAKVTISEFLLNNLVPVTLGNTIAGVFCIAGVHALCYGSAGRKLFTPKAA